MFRRVCTFFMNWCYECIFQGVWNNRIGNAIIEVSKNNRMFLNEFSGYVCPLCNFICLKVINFFQDFIAFNLRETKKQPSCNFPFLQLC